MLDEVAFGDFLTVLSHGHLQAAFLGARSSSVAQGACRFGDGRGLSSVGVDTVCVVRSTDCKNSIPEFGVISNFVVTDQGSVNGTSEHPCGFVATAIPSLPKDAVDSDRKQV